VDASSTSPAKRSQPPNERRPPLPPHIARARAQQTSSSSGAGRLLQAAADGDTTTSINKDRQALRASLLEDYDRTVYPFETLWSSSTNSNNAQQHRTTRRGLDLEVGLNFHRVFAVDVTTSVADLVVWVRMRWHDPRLAWDSTTASSSSSSNENTTTTANDNTSDTNNAIDTLHFWVGDGSGSAGEMSEIWTPDLELWNMQAPLAESLADAHASVTSDGTVFWSRPGHVKAVCKFEGLERFPFDTLDCTMELGSWAYSGLYLRPTKMDGVGYSIGGSETAGEAFAEFSLLSVECEEHVYPPYPAAPLEDWPVLMYHVTFQRSWQPYARGYLVLQVVLNLAAFACFWLPPHIGERMSLSITALLSAVASELVVAAKLPAASELTWFAKFSAMSLLFTAAALFESAAVIYFHYHTGPDLKPRWYKWMQAKAAEKEKPKPISTDVHSTESEEHVLSDKRPSVQFNEHLDLDSLEASEGSIDEKNMPPLRNYKGNKNFTRRTPRKSNDEDEDEASCSELSESARPVRRPSASGPSVSTDFSNSRTRKRIKTILGRDADDFKNLKEMENNLRWQQVAANIDEVSRVVFPVVFGIFIAVIFTKAGV